MGLGEEKEVNDPPQNGITAINFSPNPSNKNSLLVSSWDGTLRAYDTLTNTCSYKFKNTDNTPILDSCWSKVNISSAFAGDLEGNVILKEMVNDGNESQVIGKHATAVSCVKYSAQHQLTLTGSWDKLVKLWDIRMKAAAVKSLEQNGKVFAMDCAATTGHTLVLATSARRVCLYDMRKIDTAVEDRESPLKYQTRDVALFPDERGYCLTSTEGRVAVEFLDSTLHTAASPKGFTFKCHRQKVEDKTLVFPVNAVSFHPIQGTFATGGCDGVVSIWDAYSKKRCSLFRKYPTSISAMSFSNDGKQIAIASSYTFEEGQKDHPNDAIFIRAIQDSEVRPKSVKA